jgi:ribosomal protein S18 acetylase RimI-like enzyme
LAKEIYIPHYPYLWEDGGVEWYIHEYAYSVEKIEAELNDPNNLHYIAYLNNEPVGYIKLNMNAKTAGYSGEHTMELERIYIYQEGVQKGIGTQLMQFVIALAKEKQKKELVLKAMDSATQALRFYKKLGFEQVGTLTLPSSIFQLMKPEYRGMYILKLIL